MNNSNFQKIVRDLHRRGFSVSQIAVLVGTSQSTADRIKHGKTTPRVAVRIALMEIHKQCQDDELGVWRKLDGLLKTVSDPSVNG